MITFGNQVGAVQVSNQSTIAFYDANFITGYTTRLDQPAIIAFFKALPRFDIKFDIQLKQYKQAGRLVYEYNAFHNLILGAPREEVPKANPNDKQLYYYNLGDLYDFNISGSLWPLDLNHPLEVEIQPSYDGSVNVIALDNNNLAILINSRFSAEELDTYRVIDRKGSNDTNLYEENQLLPQIKLYKTSNVISQLMLHSIDIGGKMKCGSYIFYFKYADLDGNETDIIAESSIIPCYIGNINDPKSIRGGITNELTDKLIKLKIKHLDKSYDYINLYYVRTTSDYGEVPVESLFKITEKYVINNSSIVNNEIIITISGYESTLETTLDDILQAYNVVDRQKSLAQVQNRLFQANLTLDQSEYKDIEDIALRFYPTIRSIVNIGNLNHKYEQDLLNPGLEYYDPLNVSNYLGYWNKEIYRTGIVYIFNNNRLSPVFNTHGGQNVGELDLSNITDITNYRNRLLTGGNSENALTCYSMFDIYDSNDKRLYIPTTENNAIINTAGNKLNENSTGVFNILHQQGPIRGGLAPGINPLAIQFSTEKDVLEYLLGIGVKGFFFVRQKRIPNILFQGMTQGYLTKLEIPLLYTVDYGQTPGHRVEYILAPITPSVEVYTTGVKVNNKTGESTRLTFPANTAVNTLINKKNSFTNRFRLVDNADYIQSGTIFSLDIALNTELMSDLLVGNTLKYSKCTHNFLKPTLIQDYLFEDSLIIPSRHFYNDIFTNKIDTNVYDLKVTLVEDGNPMKYSGTKRFRGRAGIQEEAFRFELTKVSTVQDGPEIPDPDYAIRGLFNTYAGLEGGEFLSSGTLVDVHVPDFDWNKMSNYFMVRQSSFQSYYAITDKFSILEILSELNTNNKQFWTTNLYRGDCYIGNYTQRVNRNFQDNELPLNDNILGNTINNVDLALNTLNTTSIWYASTSTEGIPFLEDNYYLVNRLDVNAVQLGHWLTFKTCSNNNLAYRTIDKQHVDEYALTGSYRGFYPFNKLSWTSESKISESTLLNKGYSITLPLKNYFLSPDVPFLQDKFNNRVMFSEIHVNDSFRNGYRIFKGLNYKDYNVGWGSIVKIVEWRNNLMIIFEHGIGMIPINESELLAGGDNTGSVYIRGAAVLPPTVNPISDTFGSQWKDSVVKTSRYVYGIDHVAKKIWRTDGEKIELISDFKIQSFLNDNITLNSREKTPTVGIRNIKTHWNAFKEDIMFTYYDVDSVVDEKKWNMCYNEQLSRWITRYDWEPLCSQNINNIYFSYDRESPEKLLLLASSYINSISSSGIVVSDYEMTQTNTINLSLKSSVLEQYIPTYSLSLNDLDSTGYDNDLFQLQSLNIIIPKAITDLQSMDKYLFSIKIKAVLKRSNGSTWDTIYDVVHLRLNRSFYNNTEILLNGKTQLENYDIAYTTRFWKHGQAGIFDHAAEVKPTTWYGTTRPFEFEFMMLDNPGVHKILDNLMIISNNVAPESFTFSVTADSYTLLLLPYDIAPYGTIDQYILNRRGLEQSSVLADNLTLTTVSNTLITLDQKGMDSWKVGRLFGNMHYKEDFWYIDVLPIQLLHKSDVIAGTTYPKGKQSRVKDKLIRIRVKYDGKDLAVITLLNSLYTQTFS